MFVFFSFFCKVGKYLKDKKKKKKSSERYQSLILSLNICIKSQNICLGLIFLLEHERQIEVFTLWCIHPHNEVTSRLLFSISDEFKYFPPFTLFLLNQTQPSYTEFFFLWYISQTHSCVNAAGPELAARCVKAKESLPLLRGRIHQNHQGIAKVEQLSPSKESAKKTEEEKKWQSCRLCVIVALVLTFSFIPSCFQTPTILAVFCLQ